jgi:hypothetical protein
MYLSHLPLAHFGSLSRWQPSTQYIRLNGAGDHKALYIRRMLPLSLLGEQIATKRKTLGLTQPMLAKKARLGLSTLDALENGRLGELGYSKITNILTALGLELKLQEASAGRPTLEELIEEARDDQSLDPRR